MYVKVLLKMQRAVTILLSKDYSPKKKKQRLFQQQVDESLADRNNGVPAVISVFMEMAVLSIHLCSEGYH